MNYSGINRNKTTRTQKKNFWLVNHSTSFYYQETKYFPLHFTYTKQRSKLRNRFIPTKTLNTTFNSPIQEFYLFNKKILLSPKKKCDRYNQAEFRIKQKIHQMLPEVNKGFIKQFTFFHHLLSKQDSISSIWSEPHLYALHCYYKLLFYYWDKKQQQH